MFGKKKINEEIVSVEGVRNLRGYSISLTVIRYGFNLSNSVESYTAIFKREDETLLSLAVSEKQAQVLKKGMRGILKYKNNKVISFTLQN